MATVLYNDTCSKHARMAHCSKGALLNDLSLGKLDIAATNETEGTLDSLGLEKKLLLANPAIALVEKSRRLAHRSAISINDLEGETLIKLLSENARAGWHAIESLCEKTRSIAQNKLRSYPIHYREHFHAAQ